MDELSSWRDLRTFFEKQAEDYDTVSAELEPLGRFYLRNASPRIARLFKAGATRAATKLSLQSRTSEQTEPWELWLEYMRSEGWRGPEKRNQTGPPPRRPFRPWSEARAEAEKGARTLPRIFQTSADCCKDLEEREKSDLEPADQGNAYEKPSTTANPPKLPSVFQDLFALGRTRAEIKYANRRPVPVVLSLGIMIHDVFFAYLDAARGALRTGGVTASEVHEFTHAAWPAIFDFYFVRELPTVSQIDTLTNRGVHWRVVCDDQRWQQHLSDLAAQSEGIPASREISSSVPPSLSDPVIEPASQVNAYDESAVLGDPKVDPLRDGFLKPYLAKRSRNAIAKFAQISNSSLQRWHEGKSDLSTRNREKLAKYLKVELLAIPND